MSGTNPKTILLAMAKGETLDIGTSGFTVRRNDKNQDLWQFQFTDSPTPAISNWVGLGKAIETYQRALKG